MGMKSAALLLALAMVAILALGLWQRYGRPQRLISTGTVDIAPRARGGVPVTLDTRVIAVGATRFEEIELPNGTWIDCRGDCIRAAREAGPEFWDALNRNAGGR